MLQCCFGVVAGVVVVAYVSLEALRLWGFGAMEMADYSPYSILAKVFLLSCLLPLVSTSMAVLTPWLMAAESEVVKRPGGPGRAG